MDVLDQPHRRSVAGDRIEPLEPGGEELLPLGRRLCLGGADPAQKLRDHGRARLGRARRTCERGELARGPPLAGELGDWLEGREDVGP